MTHHSSTRPATATELSPVPTPLPQSDRFARNTNFDPLSLYRLVVEADAPETDPVVDWHIRGTSLHADIKLHGFRYEVECQTAMSGDAISEVYVDVTWLEAPPLLPGRNERHADGRLYRRRYIDQRANRELLKTLRESAEAYIEDHSHSLCLAHEAERDERRAEAVLEQEGEFA